MHLSHGGASVLVVATLRCSDYLASVIEIKARAMFDTDTNPPIALDVLQIEAEARRMRAQVIADAFGRLKARIVALFTAGAQTRAQH